MPRSTPAREILDAANRRYADDFVDLSRFYDDRGRPRKGDGDLIGQWIVGEIAESVEEGAEEDASYDEVADAAIRRLRAGIEDIGRAISGLEDLRRSAERRRP